MRKQAINRSKTPEHKHEIHLNTLLQEINES